jgi:hypothetical protein
MKGIFLLMFWISVSAVYGQQWQWAKGTSGDGYASGNSVCSDAVGNVYETGYFSKSITFGSITLTNDSR